ncbi:hypothetical protein AB5N19_09100 [Seiridium cardinale]|uniref:C2H2-type domain-containing protein n=1 Tax=Seiridium cardinale TaxID=138064 RepID=A0ABR2Y719_9PEZI
MTNNLQTSPGEAGGSTLPNSSRNVDVPRFPGSQDLAGMDMNSSLLSGQFASDQALLGSYSRQLPGTSNPLEQWYVRNDGPWIPKNLAPPGRQDAVNARAQGYGFPGTYRESISPSECDTIPPGLVPSDSGYGSHGAKQSIATASICYDDALDSQETQSLVGHFAFGMDPRQWVSPPNQTQTSRLQHPVQPEGKELICETCNKVLKTNSELKKHQQRHTKPYVCDLPNCNRVGGFSTSNDLDRHKRSIHPGEFANGNRYRCTFGGCRNKDKVWPRADNFRAHIKRVHRQQISDEDMEKFIHRTIAPQDVLPDIAGMQPPPGDYNLQLSPSIHTNFTTSYWHQDGDPGTASTTVTTMDTSLDSDSVRQLSGSHVVHGSEIVQQVDATAGVGSHTKTQDGSRHLSSRSMHLTDSSHHRPGRFSDTTRADVSCEQQFVTPGDLSHCALTLSALPDADADRALISQNNACELAQDDSDSDTDDEVTAESVDENMGKTASRSPDVPIPATDVSSLVLGLRDQEQLKQVLEALQSNGLLGKLGYKKEEASTSEETVSEATAQRQDGQNNCPTCNKGFSRRCELKKHMKRHEKPYGCTYEGCNKRFGSKNDWKRHENSQHFLLEVWKCDFRATDKPAQVCGKVSHRRETFRQHLVNNHQLTADTAEKKLEECRVGRNCEANFWCGFCEEIIKIKRKGVDAWTERYNHIDDHLAGRNGLLKKLMDDWQSVDPEAHPTPGSSPNNSEIDKTSTPLMSSANTVTINTGDMLRESTRVAGGKRKADGPGEGRHAKRSKPGGMLTARCVSMHPVTVCCQCGEGNTRSRMSLQCINGACQHTLCNNCI